MKRFKSRSLALLSAAAFALGTTALNPLADGQADAGPADAAVPLPAVPVAEVLVRGYQKTHVAIGHLEAQRTVDVTPRVAGMITEALVPEGKQVRKGEVLFRLDPGPYKIQVAIAEAHLERAIVLVEQAEVDRARAAALSGKGTASPKTLEEATALKRSRDADVAVARANLQDAELKLSYTVIRAPIDGTVDRIEVHAGNQVAAGPQTLLTRVVATDKLYAALHLDEVKYLQLASHGKDTIPVTLEVAAAPGKRLAGTVDFIGTEFDTKTGTLLVRAVIDNPGGRLKPGHFARIYVPMSLPTESIFVAEASIGTAMGGRYVQVIDDGGVVGMRTVTLGDPVGQLRLIEAGLQAGDLVILKGLVGPGMTVTPVPTTMPGAAEAFPGTKNSGEL